jgi:hypothetical protein
MEAKDLLNLINKQWATTNDIMIIGEVGYHKALLIKKEITSDLEEKKYKLPKNKVPMEFVVNYFKINISYLKKFSFQESKNLK